jgi:hypothetical protein
VTVFGGVILVWWLILPCRKEPGMQIGEDFEFLESLFVGLDPLEDGFGGVLLEIRRRGDEYVLLEMAPTTGNRLLRFSSKDRELVYAALAQELGASLRQTLVGLHPLSYTVCRSWGSPRRLHGSQDPLVEILLRGVRLLQSQGTGTPKDSNLELTLPSPNHRLC